MKYKLDIIDDKGSVFTVVGGNNLREIAEQWRNETFDTAGRFVVQGFGDCARLPPITIAMERETVKGLLLEEL